jgi:hypothetical protein
MHSVMVSAGASLHCLSSCFYSSQQGTVSRHPVQHLLPTLPVTQSFRWNRPSTPDAGPRSVCAREAAATTHVLTEPPAVYLSPPAWLRRTRPVSTQLRRPGPCKSSDREQSGWAMTRAPRDAPGEPHRSWRARPALVCRRALDFRAHGIQFSCLQEPCQFGRI